MRTTRSALGMACVLFVVSAGVQGRSAACPFCSAPSLTLSEQLAQSDAAVLVQWAGGEKSEKQNPGTTVYEVVRVLKAPGDAVKKGTRITLARYRAGSKGDLFLLTGTQATAIEWSSPLEVTETSFNYIAQAPSPEAPPEKRLAYFLKFLEYPDPTIANDAYAEFANAPFKEIAPLAQLLPRDKIRAWVVSDDTPATRLGLYGLMLGLCGTEEDARLMEKKITEATNDFRLGIDGVIFGYLLLTGDKGLDVIDEHKLKNKKVPFSETYAAMQALRQLWEYGEGRISKDRLRQSMRLLLDRPELADLVIADLARWKDWTVQDRLMELYGTKEYDIPSIRRAVVRYLLVSAKDVPDGPDGGADGGTSKPPEHVINAKKYLEDLRERDPRAVREAERFFFLK